jgi:hypothetical protein
LIIVRPCNTTILVDAQQTNAFRLYSFIEDDNMLSTARIVFYLCFALVAIILIDAVWVGYQFSQHKIRFIFTVKFLRGISEIVTGPLYIPIVAIFTMQLPCHGEVGCWSDAGHVFLALAAALIGSLYIALSITLTGSFYSRDPIAASTSPLARPTSRVMMAQLGVKTALTICFILLYSFDAARWFLLVLLAVGTSGLAFLYTHQLPYFRFEFNVARACTFWILSWASLCLIITELSGADASQYSGTSLLFLVGSPFVAAAAYMATQCRKMSIMRHAFNEIESPSEIELKARFLLEHVTEIRSHRALGLNQLPASSTKKDGAAGKAGSAPIKTGDLKESLSAAATGNANQSLDAENAGGLLSARMVQRRLETLEESKRLLEETTLIEEVYSVLALMIACFVPELFLRGNNCTHRNSAR